MSASFDRVPVVLIHKDNVEKHWKSLLDAIRGATFLAMDLEMTGLGNRKLLMSKDVDIRYSQMKEVAETRSIVSMGLSCFSHQASTPPEFVYHVRTYNIILLCEENYVVEPVSLRFLTSHGFDFNQQYARGVGYCRGNDKDDIPVERTRIRDLFSEIVRRRVPVVLHNAMVDLVYMYQNFYCQLPNKMDTFLADLSEIFAGGIIDTKYISDFLIRWPASYLEYTFRRCQMENRSRLIGGDSHVMLRFGAEEITCSDVEYRECGLPSQTNNSQTPCENYAAHGNCPLRDDCPHSHDIDVILADEFTCGIQYLPPKHKRRRKRDKTDDAAALSQPQERNDAVTSPGRSNGSTPIQGMDTVTESDKSDDASDRGVSQTRCEGHRAGFDAFMTGFILCHYLSRENPNAYPMDFDALSDVVNNIYATGKDIPFVVRKGSFAKTSKAHRTKLERVRSKDDVS